MGHILIKTAPDTDLYVVWSTSAEGPIFVGDRYAAVERGWREWRREHPHCVPAPGYGPAAEVERADETGTGAEDPAYYGWDTAGLIFAQQGWLPRGRLTDFAKAADVDDEPAMYRLLEPFEDRTEQCDGCPCTNHRCGGRECRCCPHDGGGS